MILEVKKDDIVLDTKAMGFWCKLPYPNHPKGCPNFGKKKTCPPFSNYFQDIVTAPYFLVIQTFNLEAQAKRMKERHPQWTDRQCRNLLYWQKGVNKKLKQEAINFLDEHNEELLLLEIPEANGVHVFKTCENIGITLERNPRKIIKKIMMIGKRKHTSDFT